MNVQIIVFLNFLLWQSSLTVFRPNESLTPIFHVVFRVDPLIKMSALISWEILRSWVWGLINLPNGGRLKRSQKWLAGKTCGVWFNDCAPTFPPKQWAGESQPPVNSHFPLSAASRRRHRRLGTHHTVKKLDRSICKLSALALFASKYFTRRRETF